MKKLLLALTVIVSYTVANNTGIITSGVVSKESPAIVELPIALVTNDDEYASRFNGVYLNATNGGELSVIVVNHRPYTLGDYLAYPYHDFQVSQYQYYAVSTEFEGDNILLSEILLVGNENNTTVTIIPTQTIMVPMDFQNATSESITIAAGSVYTFTIHRLQTFLFGIPELDMSGTSIVSDKPLTVLSGHECVYIPSTECCCDHIIEQIPPTITWGKNFLLTPFAERINGPFYKIIAAESQTTFTYTCAFNDSIFSNTSYLTLAGDFITLSSNASSYCFIHSDKPILVTKLGPGRDPVSSIGDPVVSLITPIEQYQNNTAILIPSFSLISNSYINIATRTIGPVYIDGQEAEDVTWENIYNSNSAIVGYGTQIFFNSSLNSTTYVISMQSTFGTMVYGFGHSHGYTFSATTYFNTLVQNPLQLEPWYGNMLGGVPIMVSGPTFGKPTDDIKLSLDNVEVVCSHLNAKKALCVTPFLNKTGKVNAELTVQSIKHKRTAIYYSIPSEDDVKVDVPNTATVFKVGNTLNILWEPTSLSGDANSKVDISMHEVSNTSNGTFVHNQLIVLATNIANSGHATVNISTTQLLSALSSVSAVNIFVKLRKDVQQPAVIDTVLNKIGLWSRKLHVSFNETLSAILYQKCLNWASNEPATIGPVLLASVTATAPCPPTVEQATPELSPGLIEDTNKKSIDTFHSGASRCFRQRTATNIGAGNQCCYRASGTLIVGSPNGGSVDKVAPTGSGLDYISNVYGHFTEDVLPYIYCCTGMKRNCTKYYERRTSDDGTSYVDPTPPGGGVGDPHIITLDLYKYTFNGKGEFILIETEDQSFALQGRMEESVETNGTTVRGTVFTAIVAKQEESDIVQFEIQDGVLVALVNGKLSDFSELKTQEFRNVVIYNSDSSNSTFSAYFINNRVYIKVQEMNGFIAALTVTVPSQYRGLTRGLMGNYNGNDTDDLIPRGLNQSLPLNSSLQTIHEDFGMTWIIKNARDSLFSYSFSKTLETYYDPSYTPTYEAVFTDPSLEQEAIRICGNDEFCKFDIAATGRVEIGEATFNGGQAIEQLVNLSKPIICVPPCAHGACVDTNVCACGEGYEGTTCNITVTRPCTENPCNDGSCQYHAGTYICTCLSGLTGEFCEETINTSPPGPETSGDVGLVVALAIGIGLPLIILILSVVIVVLVLVKCGILPSLAKREKSENTYDEPNNFNDDIYEDINDI
uniref:EGF-like domain-containing protein n=1 Tax=Amphimedon queenslandica TaxID=400682 RepID=A0A1X7V5I7_AMPQE